MINKEILKSLIEELGTDNRINCDIWLNNQFRLCGILVNNQKIYIELMNLKAGRTRSYVIYELLNRYQKLIFNEIVRLFLDQKPQLIIELL